MSQDLEKIEATADLRPLHGPAPYNGSASYSGDLPDYLEAVPPYGPTDGWKDTVDRVWSNIMRWPRYAVLGFMWVSFTFWRFLYVIGTAVLVILLIVNR